MRQAEADWQALMTQVRAEMDQGTDPTAPRVQELARRWMGLVRAFTGGNPEIHRSLQNVWEQETTIHGMDTVPVREMMAYISRALPAEGFPV